MKKYTFVLFILVFVFGLFIFNTNLVNATGPYNDYTPGCSSTQGYSPTTGEKCTIIVYSSLPPGCTSTTGYSPLTGVKCDSFIVNTTLPLGCTSTQGYSPTTGVKCDSLVNTSLPTGCTSTVGFSPITGQSCSRTLLPAIIYPPGCISYSGYSSTTGMACSETTSQSPVINQIFSLDAPCSASWSCKYNAEGIVVAGRVASIYGKGLLGNIVIKIGGYEIKQYLDGTGMEDIVYDGYTEFTIPSNLTPGVNYVTITNDSGKISNLYKVNVVASNTTSQVPVISGVSGPQLLNVNQQGTWTVTASSPDGGNLSYSVIWGDENVYPYTGANSLRSPLSQQSATLTHSYLQAGNYTPTFTVTSNASGLSAKTSLSVNVNNVVIPMQPLSITTPSVLPNAKVGIYYANGFQAVGGSGGSYAFALDRGVLPSGLSIGSNNLFGTPTVAGTYIFSVIVYDTAPQSGIPIVATKQFTLIVAPATCSAFGGFDSTTGWRCGCSETYGYSSYDGQSCSIY